MKSHLAIYTSHDSSAAVRCADGSYRVVELERIAGQRYYSLALNREHCGVVLPKMLAQLRKWTDIEGAQYLSLHPNQDIQYQLSKYGHEPIPGCNHHDAHAACAFYQSTFQEATVITYDGGGHDLDGNVQYFCCYDATRDGGCIRRASIRYDLGTAYIRAAQFVDEIRRTSSGEWLPWPGKLMALAGYGSPNIYEVENMIRFFKYDLEHETAWAPFQNRQLAWCATAQLAFEIEALRVIEGWAPKSKPLCIAGGCALNVKVNQLLRDRGYTVFVPPNPNDSGLTLGMLLAQDRPKEQVVCTFNGMDWPGGEEEYPEISIYDVSDLIRNGKIVGFIEGSSELGPRALGHRSILCRGDLPYARARLNAIKGREWYRPVSPVFKREIVDGDSPFMSFAPSTNEHAEWVHADRTFRVQTVNGPCSLKALLGALCHRPLINTSLNLRGRPLCNDMDHALELLQTTALDCLVINGHLIEKKRVNWS